MKSWLEQMNPRERRWLSGGVAAAALVLLAGLVWWPLQEHRARLGERVESQRQTLAWMEAARQRVERARAGQSAGDTPRGQSGQSLLSLVDAGVRGHGFENQLRRAEPAGDGGVRLWLEGVGFGDLARWLETLDAGHGVTVAELRLERAGDGMVHAQMVLEAAPGG